MFSDNGAFFKETNSFPKRLRGQNVSGIKVYVEGLPVKGTEHMLLDSGNLCLKTKIPASPTTSVSFCPQQPTYLPEKKNTSDTLSVGYKKQNKLENYNLLVACFLAKKGKLRNKIGQCFDRKGKLKVLRVMFFFQCKVGTLFPALDPGSPQI